MTLHRTEIPSTAPSLKTWILLADWLAGRSPKTELPRRFGPCPHSHQTTIMIMQMHSEKARDITSYQVELGLFEVTGFCQFQLTRVFCLDIIYLFAWKLQLFFFFKCLGRGKKIILEKIFFPRAQRVHKLRKERPENAISVITMDHHCLPGPPGWGYLSQSAAVIGGLELGLTLVVSDSRGHFEVPHTQACEP